MKFQVGYVKEEADHEDFLERIRAFAETTMGWSVPTRPRIRSIRFIHDGKPGVATVGEEFHDEPVFAIFKSNAYLVCSYNRGVKQGMPFLIGLDEATGIEYFEGFEDSEE